MDLLRAIRAGLRGQQLGAHKDELIQAQRDVVLQRVVVLAWISLIVMPTACCTWVYFKAPQHFVTSVWIVGAAIVAVLIHKGLVARGLFDRHYHLAMLLLVAGIFGPTGSAIMSLAGATGGGDFLFAFFLIFFAFTALFPADLKWILLTSLAVTASYAAATVLMHRGFSSTPYLAANLIYFGELTFIGAVLNRVLVQLFFDERKAQIALREARDSLFAEMEVAQGIQKLLLPREPQLPAFQIHGVMNPADEVGGDYYDVIVTEGGRRLFAIGDVSGHGVTTGLTMMMARASLVGTLEARPDASLVTLYQAMNGCLRRNLERMDQRLYMTFALFEDLGNGRIRAVGGHLPALVYRNGKKAVEEIEMAGLWLGVFDQVTSDMVPETEFSLAPGDTLLLMTDGVVERNGQDGEMFGFDRTHDVLREHAPRGPYAVVETLLARLSERGGLQDDDVTVLCMRYQGAHENPQVVKA